MCAYTVSWSIEPDDPALVSLWLCDDGAGDTITDSSGNGNDATGNFEWDEGKFDGGILIAGGAITVDTSDSIDSVKEAITIAAWFRVDADSDTGIRRQNAFLLEDQSSSEPVPNGFSFRIWTTSGLSPGVYGTTELEQGEWYHVVGTYDGEFMKLYVNGVAEEELLDSSGGNINGDWTGDIGTPGDQLQLKYASESYTGGMDEIVLFNRALDDDEIAALANGWEAAMPVDSQSKLAATWGTVKSLQR
jgi:hypothetical protein